MKSLLMTSAAAAILSLGLASPALADCAADIAALKSQINTGSIDSANTTAKPAAVEKTSPAADASASNGEMATAAPAQGTAGMGADQAAAADSAASAPVASEGGAPAAGTIPGTEATAAMNKATEGIATSPAEVDAQQTAQPAETAPSQDQIAQAGETPAASTAPTSGGEPVDMQGTILARAEAYQKLGNEGACMNAVQQAKAL